MRIEAGASLVAISAGSAVKGGLESGGPKGLNTLGQKLDFVPKSFVAEGPAPFSLKDTMTYTINDRNLIRGGDRFIIEPNLIKPEVRLQEPALEVAEGSLDIVSVVAEAELVLSQSRSKKEEVPDIFYQALGDLNLDPTVAEEEYVSEPEIDRVFDVDEAIPEIQVAESSLPLPDVLTPPKLLYKDRVLQQLALMFVLAHVLLPLHPEPEKNLELNTYLKPKIGIEQTFHLPTTHATHHPVEHPTHPEEPEGEEDSGELGFQEQEHIERIVKPTIVVAEKVMETRGKDVTQAVEVTGAELVGQNKRIIEGLRVVYNLGVDHIGRRSETLNEEDPNNIVPDGSWEKIKDGIREQNFSSVQEAKFIALRLIKKFRPEKKGEGDEITDEEHKVIHDKHNHSLKKPVNIFEKRVLKKRVFSPEVSQGDPILLYKAKGIEPTIEELNLEAARVLKAA